MTRALNIAEIPSSEVKEFSFTTRAQVLKTCESHQYDLTIIGGGITGVGIALEAARRGYKVLLLEKSDFAEGTSSKSTKLIHGGLRYLENLEFGLVYNARQERGRLLELAPHLVQEEPIIFPLYKGGSLPKWKLKLGLSLYDLFSINSVGSPHRMLSQAMLARSEPFLDSPLVAGAGLFYDASTDDARLTLYSARTAAHLGAELISQAEVKDVIFDPSTHRCEGVVFFDKLSQKTHKISSKFVVGALGPWTNNFLAKFGGNNKVLKPSSGIHLVFSKNRLPIKHTLALLASSDKRLVFVRPWINQLVFVGTTDSITPDSPENWWGEPSELDYLLKVLQENFPKANLQKKDILGLWAGQRPLLNEEQGSTYHASREHNIWEERKGLLMIGGGKLTSFLKMGQETVQEFERCMRRDFPAYSSARKAKKQTKIIGAEKEWYTDPSQVIDSLKHLKSRYGSETLKIINILSRVPQSEKKISKELPYLWAEVLYSIKYEMTLSLSDFMCRRTQLIFETKDHGLELASQIAVVMGEYSSWDKSRCHSELENYQALVQKLVASIDENHHINTPKFESQSVKKIKMI